MIWNVYTMKNQDKSVTARHKGKLVFSVSMTFSRITNDCIPRRTSSLNGTVIFLPENIRYSKSPTHAFYIKIRTILMWVYGLWSSPTWAQLSPSRVPDWQLSLVYYSHNITNDKIYYTQTHTYVTMHSTSTNNRWTGWYFLYCLFISLITNYDCALNLHLMPYIRN